jgi:hypothetical protein
VEEIKPFVKNCEFFMDTSYFAYDWDKVSLSGEKKIEKLKDDFQYEVKARDESMRLLRKIKENRKNPNLPKERQKLKEALEEKYKNEND